MKPGRRNEAKHVPTCLVIPRVTSMKLFQGVCQLMVSQEMIEGQVTWMADLKAEYVTD